MSGSSPASRYVCPQWMTPFRVPGVSRGGGLPCIGRVCRAAETPGLALMLLRLGVPMRRSDLRSWKRWCITTACFLAEYQRREATVVIDFVVDTSSIGVSFDMSRTDTRTVSRCRLRLVGASAPEVLVGRLRLGRMKQSRSLRDS